MLNEKQMQAKQYLKQAYRCNELLKSSLEEIENLRAMTTSIASPDLTKERVSGTPSQEAHFVGAVNKLVDLERIAVKQCAEYIRIHSETHDLIKQLDNPDYICILQMRYLTFYTWERIASEMGITYMWVTVQYKKALDAFTDILTAKGIAA